MKRQNTEKYSKQKRWQCWKKKLWRLLLQLQVCSRGKDSRDAIGGNYTIFRTTARYAGGFTFMNRYTPFRRFTANGYLMKSTHAGAYAKPFTVWRLRLLVDRVFTTAFFFSLTVWGSMAKFVRGMGFFTGVFVACFASFGCRVLRASLCSNNGKFL